MDTPPLLATLHVENRELAKVDRRLAFTTYPDLFSPILLRPCTVHILMVLDTTGAFTDQDFGLTELLHVLSISPGPFVRFAVTKAHRSPAGFYTANADIVSFKFDGHDLSVYDQVWMVALGRAGQSPLTDSELAALSRFMDGGGGVFAVGDHEDLGVAMCGRVPRVRSMRKWYWPNPGPNGEPVAPGGADSTRLDTNQPGHNSVRTFDDQSDDVPQTIHPVMHTVPSPYLFQRISIPHPLLCGPRGIIRVLPDHPHEGECYVPQDLSASFTFDGYTIQEYPIASNGVHVRPEIVSYTQSGPGIVDMGKQTGLSRSFGANCAYDGHKAGVGRVSVESTWHHIFNINLKGTPTDPDPVKQKGFYASAAGLASYEDIKAYLRNIGVWLARPSTQNCMRWRIFWAARWDSRIVMDLKPVRDLKQLELKETFRLGLEVRDVLGRYASQCQVTQWIFDWLGSLKLRLPVEQLLPWPPRPDPPPELDPMVFYYTEALVHASLGSLIYNIALRYPEANEEIHRQASDGAHRELMEEAANFAHTQVLAELRRSLTEVSRFVQGDKLA